MAKSRFIPTDFDFGAYRQVEVIRCHSYLPVIFDGTLYRPINHYYSESIKREFCDVVCQYRRISKFDWCIFVLVHIDELFPSGEDLLPF